ncbi:MAG TPA: hypothetical protein VGN48_16370, partial [Pedococcus sp.]|nr:hypothetical protein [Pedococcus sp.]
MTQESTTSSTPSRLLPNLLTANRVPRLLGNFTYLVGSFDLATGLLGSLRHRLHGVMHVLPGYISNAAVAATVVSGILLLILGHSLKRRKVRAWRAATWLVAVSLVLHVVHFDPVAGLLSAVALALLLVYRKEFRALGDPTTRWTAAVVGAALLAFSVVAGFATIWLNRKDIRGGWPPLHQVAEEIAWGLVGGTGPLAFTRDRSNDIVGAVLLGLGIMTAFTTIYLVLRPPEPRPELTEDEDVRLRELL